MGEEPRRRLTLDPGSRDAEVGRWLAALEDGRQETLIELERVTPDMVDWYPEVPLNSIGTLLYHIALIEADWVVSEILELPEEQAELAELLPWPDRQRDGQLTRIDGYPLDVHLERLAGVRTWAIERLRPMSNTEFRSTTSHRIGCCTTSCSTKRSTAPTWRCSATCTPQYVLLPSCSLAPGRDILGLPDRGHTIASNRVW